MRPPAGLSEHKFDYAIPGSPPPTECTLTSLSTQASSPTISPHPMRSLFSTHGAICSLVCHPLVDFRDFGRLCSLPGISFPTFSIWRNSCFLSSMVGKKIYPTFSLFKQQQQNISNTVEVSWSPSLIPFPSLLRSKHSTQLGNNQSPEWFL